MTTTAGITRVPIAVTRVLSAGTRVLAATTSVLTATTRVPAPTTRVLLAGTRVLAVASIVATAYSSAAAQGRISNAKLETRTLAGTLEREIQAIAGQGGTTWIGYRTAMIPGRRQMCCYDSIAVANDCCGMCRLESGGGVTMTQSGSIDTRGSRIVLEPPSDVVILARIENGAVTRIRTFTPDCDIDGGAMPIVWLENVPPADSVAWLTTLARSGGAGGDRDRENRVVQPAIGALALHPDQSALKTLIVLAREDQRAVKNQALFWLAQRAGQEAVATISTALDNDPDTEVKKRAVFALSQLPRDEGIPLLIQVARTNKNAEVRKQAMFWLGQSRDARAVSFFEEILKAK